MAENRNRGDAAFRIRVVLGTLLSTAVVFPRIYQPVLNGLWDFLRATSLYNWSTFETIWTVFCYAAIEVPLTVVYVNHPEWRYEVQEKLAREGSDGRLDVKSIRRPHGMKRPSRRWMEGLVYVAPLLLLDLTMIKKFKGVPLEDMLITGNYNPSILLSGNSTLETGYLSQPKSTFLIPTLHNMTLSSPLQTRRALPSSPPSSRRLVLELFSSLIIYDALFFLFHLVLHIIPPLRRWHQPHHQHGEIHPQVTNQLSVFERLGLVLLANFSLNVIGSHVLTRTVFVPVFIWLLVEIHSGLDLPWGYEKILPQGWAGSSRKHALHHAGTEGGLEPYFNWCDALWDRFRGKKRNVKVS